MKGVQHTIEVVLKLLCPGRVYVDLTLSAGLEALCGSWGTDAGGTGTTDLFSLALVPANNERNGKTYVGLCRNGIANGLASSRDGVLPA